MSSRRRYLLLLGLAAGAAHAQFSAISRNPAVVAGVEEACIDRAAPAWDEEEAFAAMWARATWLAREAEAPAECSPWVAGDGPATRTRRGLCARRLELEAAQGCLRFWERHDALLHELGPRREAPGTGPLLSEEYPAWRRAPARVVPARPAPPPGIPIAAAARAVDPGAPEVAYSLLHRQGRALLRVGRVEEGLASIRSAHRFARVLARGARSNQDLPLALAGLQGIRPLQVWSYWLSVEPWLPEAAPPELKTIVDDAPRLLVDWRPKIERDLEFRRCAIDLVDSRIGALAPVLFGDGRAQLSGMRRWLLEERGLRPSLAGAHPVLAEFMPLEGLVHFKLWRRSKVHRATWEELDRSPEPRPSCES